MNYSFKNHKHTGLKHLSNRYGNNGAVVLLKKWSFCALCPEGPMRTI